MQVAALVLETCTTCAEACAIFKTSTLSHSTVRLAFRVVPPCGCGHGVGCRMAVWCSVVGVVLCSRGGAFVRWWVSENDLRRLSTVTMQPLVALFKAPAMKAVSLNGASRCRFFVAGAASPHMRLAVLASSHHHCFRGCFRLSLDASDHGAHHQRSQRHERTRAQSLLQRPHRWH